MSPVMNQMLNARREKECVGLTTERKYFHVDGAWIKRSLRPSEWQTNPFASMLLMPRFCNEVMNVFSTRLPPYASSPTKRIFQYRNYTVASRTTALSTS